MTGPAVRALPDARGYADPPPGLDPDPDTTPARLGTIYARSELTALPTVHSLVAGILSQPAAVVLVGGYGLGKTILVHALGCCVATGTPWLGRPVEARRTLLVVGEGAYGLDARLAAWEHASHRGAAVPDDRLTVIVKPGSLREAGTWQLLTEYAVAGAYGFVALDTFSSLAPDADEVKDAALIMRRISDLSTAINGTALLVHHPGWSDANRVRGGYQFEANADEVLVLSGVAEGSELVCLTRKKVKDGPDGGALWLRRANSHGSVVFEQASADAAEVPLRARIVAALDGYGEVGATGPQLIAECGIADRDKSGFYKAMRHLTDDASVTATGERNRRRYYLAARTLGGDVWTG